MKKKSIAVFTSILITLLSSEVYASNSEEILNKYKTETQVMLNGEALKIPVEYSASKDEFRAMWIATVANIDFPSKDSIKDGLITKEEYMADFTKILDRAVELNLNALIFQVSPMLDAWYKSDVNPWSQYLSGNQGKDPGYDEWDSLEWSIKETNKRGLEFHAWFNPYRVTNNPKDEKSKEEKLSELADGNFAKKNPQAVYEFNNKLYLDPGRPEVVKHIEDTVEEVIKNYDIDAVHFDDYFYPYQYSNSVVKEEECVDIETFNEFGDKKSDINDWRRENVNGMIKSVGELIDKYNQDNDKCVEFGISPFGIWGHASNTGGLGSDTPAGSTSSYQDYVDSLKWAKEGWIDYLAPQVYWSFANTSAPYGELVDWWADKFSKIKESHLYIGHANYKNLTGDTDSDWANYDEILSQLRFNKKYDQVKGSSFFSFRNVNKNESEGQNVNNKFLEELEASYFNTLANIPAKPWLDKMKTKPIENIRINEMDDCVELMWEDSNKDTRFYGVYRVEGNKEEVDISNSSNFIARIGKEAGMNFKDANRENGKEYTYAVTVIDEAGNETNPIIINSNSKSTKKSNFNMSNIGMIIGGVLLVICSILGIILSTIL